MMASQNLFYQPETFEREPSTGSTIRDVLVKTQMIVEEIQYNNLDNLNRINDILKNICDRLGCV